MAVKQKVVEFATPSKEARLQIILRFLQNFSGQDGIQDKNVTQTVLSLGTVPIPTDPDSYMRFYEDIRKVQSILAKECSDQKHIFNALKTLFKEISNPSKQVSPAMSIVLQLIHENDIPNAVKYILNAGYPDQNIEHALYTLCNWLTQCVWTENLGSLVLTLMKGLEADRHYDILVEVTHATIERLFKLVILPNYRAKVGPVVLYMLSRNQQNPQIFHKVIPLMEKVCKELHKENKESSILYLSELINLSLALMDHFPGYNELYEPLKKVIQPYCSDSNHKQSLLCQPWGTAADSLVQTQYSIGKVGLNNLGNTCYMNSVLQALFMTKTFRNEVLLYNKAMLPLFSKLQVLFALLQYSKRFSLSPSDILNLSRPPGFQLGHQHDSSEFLGYLLDTLHEQESNQSSSSETIEEAAAAAVALCPPTVVQQSFGGRTITVSHCFECGTKSERADHFRELQLSFPNTSEEQSVQTLMDYYLQAEKLTGENQYRCDVCGKLTDGERVTRVVEAPARLILTLKHFRYDPASHTRTKLLQAVKLDRQMLLGSASSSGPTVTHPHQYELYAAVVHCGSSVDSGHYYTFAKDGDTWYKFNDCSVVETTAENLCRLSPPETPYILFYSRVDVSEPEALPCTILPDRLQLALTKDHSEYEAGKRLLAQRYLPSRRSNQNGDDPPPPGCGGGGFSATSSNMFVC